MANAPNIELDPIQLKINNEVHPVIGIKSMASWLLDTYAYYDGVISFPNSAALEDFINARCQKESFYDTQFNYGWAPYETILFTYDASVPYSDDGETWKYGAWIQNSGRLLSSDFEYEQVIKYKNEHYSGPIE